MTAEKPTSDLQRLQRYLLMDTGEAVQIEFEDTGLLTADGKKIYRQVVSSVAGAESLKVDYANSTLTNFDQTDLSLLFDGEVRNALSRAAVGQDSNIDVYLKTPVLINAITVNSWNTLGFSNMKVSIYDLDWNAVVVLDDSADNTIKFGETISFTPQYVGGFKVEWIQTTAPAANALIVGEISVKTIQAVDTVTPLSAYEPAPVDAFVWIPGARSGYAPFEDASFIAGDSPASLDVNTALGRNGKSGTLWNTGAGAILVEFSEDGAAFGTQFTLPPAGIINLTGLNIDTIRLTHSGADSAYLAVVN